MAVLSGRAFASALERKEGRKGIGKGEREERREGEKERRMAFSPNLKM